LSAVFDRLIKTHISLRLGDGSSLGALWELLGSSLGALWELVAVAGTLCFMTAMTIVAIIYFPFYDDGNKWRERRKLLLFLRW
jgi:hypothetical protein